MTISRKAHKRGHSTHTRGLSHEKVCVPLQKKEIFFHPLHWRH